MSAQSIGGGGIQALCLSEDGPLKGKFVFGAHFCGSWKSGHFGAVDEPPDYGKENRRLYAEEENYGALIARNTDFTAERDAAIARAEKAECDFVSVCEQTAKKEIALRAERDAAIARAEKAEAECDRLSERMRVRLVEFGEKADAARAEARELRGLLQEARPLLDWYFKELPFDSIAQSEWTTLERIDAALAGKGEGDG